jgi:hypothetical protein
MAGRGGEMSDLCDQRMQNLMDAGEYQMNEYEKRIDELEADYVSKKALREWCENCLNIYEGKKDFYSQSHQSIFEIILDQFCKEGEL